MIPCSSCGGAYHEATGHIMAWPTVLCWACTLHWIAFLKSHQKRKWGGFKFYDYAATSIKPETGPERT